ncbi:ferredoxin-type protein NapF [Ruegeria sp. HKCCD8929]|uniref:ferredoxin-type protein NapF n=1 Tax=Ruegeria sp. HKCCD8929 TaxID=2683006 RepID=UPI0020C52706|nr:ferredoxin-type protein NapF [Ruegeria sp. HKCCD8929]
MFRQRSDYQRPPWSTESSIRNACIGCRRCIEACPEGILFAGYADTPAIDFELGECTFCGACAEACDEAVFAEITAKPWDQIAVIGSGCIQAAGIGCQLCTDTCPQTALRLDLSHRPVGRIAVNAEACNGCGACLPVCPVGAITVETPKKDHLNG